MGLHSFWSSQAVYAADNPNDALTAAASIRLYTETSWFAFDFVAGIADMIRGSIKSILPL